MGIWKRAYLYITRKKERSIRLFLTFFAAALFLLTVFSVREGAKEGAGEIRKSLAAGLTLKCMSMDPYKMADIGTNENGETVWKYKLPLITEKQIDALLAVDGVSGFFSDMESVKVYTKLTLVPSFSSLMLDIMSGKVPEQYSGQREYLKSLMHERDKSQTDAHTASLIGVYDSRWYPAFVNGAAKLVKGRHIGLHEEGKVVISDELAEKNGLKIGGKLEIQSFEDHYGNMPNELYGSIYEAEIAGIFHINFEQPMGEYISEQQLLANMIFCTPDVMYWYSHEEQVYYEREVIAPESESHLEEMVLFVEDPALLDSVKEKLLQLDAIGWEYYEIGVYDKDYQTAAMPLLVMIRISNMLAAMLAIGLLLLLVRCLSRWVQNRKYEINLLFSVGIKQGEVLLQFIVECCCMAAPAFFAAAVFAEPVSNMFGNGLWTVLYSASNTRGYEVVSEPYASVIEVNILPVKGEALSYAITPEMRWGVWLLLMVIAAAAASISSRKILRKKPQGF